VSDEVLLIGYGNPGRADDGLGPALVERLRCDGCPGVILDSDNQLTVEHAYDLAPHQTVVFADAAMRGQAPFTFRLLEAREPRSFTTHSLAPEAVLFLARTLFGAKTEAYLLGIRGYEFDLFRESLSAAAQRNLELASRFVLKFSTHRR